MNVAVVAPAQKMVQQPTDSKQVDDQVVQGVPKRGNDAPKKQY